MSKNDIFTTPMHISLTSAYFLSISDSLLSFRAEDQQRGKFKNMIFQVIQTSEINELTGFLKRNTMQFQTTSKYLKHI